MTTNILIAGGGIGGLTTAIALHRHGIDCEVFEQASAIRASGSGITLQTNAMTVMEELGLAESLREEGRPLQGGSVRDFRGRTLQRMEMDDSLGPRGVGIHRQRLLRILAEACDAPVHVGRRVDSVNTTDGSVEVVFDDGSTRHGAALIACDGLHSAVRAQLAPDDLVYAHYTTWRGIARGLDVPSLGMTEFWGAGERFGVVPIGHGETYWFAVADAPPGGSDGSHPRDEMLDRFAGWPDPVEDLLRATEDDEIIRTDTWDREPLDRWVFGRAALLGDAAHPMTPNLGQGAGQAIEDALAIARALDTHSDIESAFETYEAVRLERANWFVRQSRMMGKMAQYVNPVARWGRNLAMRLTPHAVVRKSMERMYSPVFE